MANPAPFAPALKAVAITKSDTTVYDPVLRGIYVGGAGDVTVIMANDTSPVTFKAPPVGTTLNISVKKVMDATTATQLIGLR